MHCQTEQTSWFSARGFGFTSLKQGSGTVAWICWWWLLVAELVPLRNIDLQNSSPGKQMLAGAWSSMAFVDWLSIPPMGGATTTFLSPVVLRTWSASKKINHMCALFKSNFFFHLWHYHISSETAKGVKWTCMQICMTASIHRLHVLKLSELANLFEQVVLPFCPQVCGVGNPQAASLQHGFAGACVLQFLLHVFQCGTEILVLASWGRVQNSGEAWQCHGKSSDSLMLAVCKLGAHVHFRTARERQVWWYASLAIFLPTNLLRVLVSKITTLFSVQLPLRFFSNSIIMFRAAYTWAHHKATARSIHGSAIARSFANRSGWDTLVLNLRRQLASGQTAGIFSTLTMVLFQRLCEMLRNLWQRPTMTKGVWNDALGKKGNSRNRSCLVQCSFKKIEDFCGSRGHLLTCGPAVSILFWCPRSQGVHKSFWVQDCFHIAEFVRWSHGLAFRQGLSFLGLLLLQFWCGN